MRVEVGGWGGFRLGFCVFLDCKKVVNEETGAGSKEKRERSVGQRTKGYRIRFLKLQIGETRRRSVMTCKGGGPGWGKAGGQGEFWAGKGLNR